MVPAQVLHGIVVAGLVIGSPLYVESVVPEQLRATAQNLLAMVGVSVGGLLSNLCAGWLLDVSGADAPYQFGGFGALIVAALLFPGYRAAASRHGSTPESGSIECRATAITSAWFTRPRAPPQQRRERHELDVGLPGAVVHPPTRCAPREEAMQAIAEQRRFDHGRATISVPHSPSLRAAHACSGGRLADRPDRLGSPA
jgi:MFS family permease